MLRISPRLPMPLKSAPSAAALAALALAASLTAAVAHGAKPKEAGQKGSSTVTAYRVLVADHGSGTLTLVDAETGATLMTARADGPARLHRSPDHRFIVAAQREHGVAQVIDSGVTMEGHGDHLDLKLSPPTFLRARLEGRRPAHVNFGPNTVAVFFDLDGAARTADLRALAAGTATIGTIATEHPHHGLAAPHGALMAVSIPHPTDRQALPIGLEMRDAEGRVVARSDACPRLHGEGKTGEILAVGCADGLLLFRGTRAGGTFEKLPYAADLPAERLVRNLWGSEGTRSLIGDFGPDGMVLVDPVARSFQFIRLPAPRMHATREALLGTHAFVITADGTLHKINALTGAIEGSLAVTPAYSMEGGWQVARPRLSATGARIVVSDPDHGRIHVVDSERMTLLRTIALSGKPFDVALAGGEGEQH